MKEDSTFLLSESTGWIVDWAHPAFEICRDKHRGLKLFEIDTRL